MYWILLLRLQNLSYKFVEWKQILHNVNKFFFIIIIIIIIIIIYITSCLDWWLARLTSIQEVPGSVLGYTL